jgi:diacylglycerol O-acyltransferase/trehalose O-mycolyltransferase
MRTRRLIPAALLVLLLTAGPARASGLEVTESRQLTPRLSELTMSTAALDFPVKVRILLPSGYRDDPHRRYPVLYLLHGSFDDASSWTRSGDAERITAGLPVVVVMPATTGKGNAGGWASDWRNEGRGGPPRWETFTIGQLLPWVDAHYRTRAERSGRAVAGLSMGGFSSMSYAVRHPDLFIAAASFSGAVDTNNGEVQPVIQLETSADGGTTPDAIWGPRATDEIYWHAHNPWDLAANLRGMTLSIRTGNGQRPPGESGFPDPIEAGVHDMSVSLHQRLGALGIPHVWDDYGAGTHSWPYWQRDLKLELPRIMSAFANSPAPPAFDYRGADPDFSVWGWSFQADRRRAEEFLDIHAASPHGVTLTGSGTETVTTSGYFKGLSRVDVSGEGGVRSIRPSRSGQITFAVGMGPPHPDQQYTDQAVLAGQDRPGYFAVRTVRFDPHARLLLGPTRGMGGARRGHAFRIRVRALGRRLTGVRIVVRDARGRTVARSRPFSVGDRRKRVRVRVARRLRTGRYSIAGAGRDALGRGVRAQKPVRVRRPGR